ncbi:hypothetical protein V500_06830 [Pseudogymnoascus sp. VKM F-4518 (FW-2643)]|nr:hypothetical protein V500_06830 [Pseudogymnoascus sp. VKM F-4518 (FW-2643)]
MRFSPLLAGATAFLTLTCTVLAAPNNHPYNNGINRPPYNNGTNHYNNGTNHYNNGTNHYNNGTDLFQGKRQTCLTDHEVEFLQWRWINFFTNFDPAIAEKSIAECFQLFSESLNYVTTNFKQSNAANPVYANKAAFIAGQTGVKHPGQTPNQLFTVVASDHGCNSFTFRWTQNVSPPVAGIDLVFVERDSYLIEKAYSEFNTKAS